MIRHHEATSKNALARFTIVSWMEAVEAVEDATRVRQRLKPNPAESPGSHLAVHGTSIN